MRFHVRNQKKTWLLAALVGVSGGTLMAGASASATAPHLHPAPAQTADKTLPASSTPAPGSAFGTWTYNHPQLAAMVPEAISADVNSPKAIVKALHDSLDGPQGPWDSNRFRSLFLPNAQITSVGPNEQGEQAISNESMTDFINQVQDVHHKSGYYDKVIKFNNISVVTKNGGKLATVDYEGGASTTPNGALTESGEDQATLMFDGTRWFVLAATF
jgi:hypothetical protein